MTGQKALAFCFILAAFAPVSLRAAIITSADFASAWNSNASSIIITGAPLPGNASNYGITISDYLNSFSGTSLSINSVGGTPDGTALYLGQYVMAFSPGWNNDISADIQNLSIYNAANGAIIFGGNGIGAHNYSVSGTYFYGNSSGQNGGAVSLAAQIQSAADNNFILTDNDFTSNAAANGGAVYMASNNSLQYGAANPTVFSVIDDTGTQGHYIAMNKAVSGNGGGIYFIYNNSQGDGVNDFNATGYTYYQNYAANWGGAIYFSVINGNDPTINNLNISGGQFVQNQATNGGAIATEINGGSTNINVVIDGNFYGNYASQNGGAIYKVNGNQYSPYGGTIEYNISGNFDGNKATVGGAIYSNINPGQAVLHHSVSGNFTNNYASANGGAIYNYRANGRFNATGLDISDGTLFWGNGATYGGAIYNDGFGVINLNTGTNGITFGNNYAASSANGADIYQATNNAIINILGTGIVNINDGIGGLGVINQGTGTAFNLNAGSQSFGYTGAFNQAAGATLNSSGVMFGGLNNFGGTANINSSAKRFYFNASMLDNSTLNFYSTSSSRVNVAAAANLAAAGIAFEGTGAAVNFHGAMFNLQNDITNGESNQITFNDSDITFGATSFGSSTNYHFANSVINLAQSSSSYQSFSFGNLSADNAASLSLKIGNDLGALQLDTVNVAAGGGTIGLGQVYVDDENGIITGMVRAIYGNVLKFQNGLVQTVATSLGTYNITTINDQYLQFSAITTGGGGNSITQNPDTGLITVDTGGSGGGTTSITQDPDTGLITVDTGGGNTTVVNPGDGGTVDIPGGQVVITPGGDGESPTVNINTPDTGAATVLVLNDVNALTPTAIAATFSSATARAWQIGANEVYYNAADLDPMAAGTFSVHGANSGTRTSVLSGLNATDLSIYQSLFNVGIDDTYFTLADLTVENSTNVLTMNNANSTALLSDLLIQQNNGVALNILAGTVSVQNTDWDHNTAGAIYNNANLQISAGSFTNNTAASGGAIYNDANGTLTIYSGTSEMNFTGNVADTGAGGAIYNAGNLTLVAMSGGDIVFSENYRRSTGNDLYNSGILTFASTGGSISFNGGISGTSVGVINKDGAAILNLNGDNSQYLGAFNMSNGIVNANGNFFGGTSNINAGTLNWNADAAKDDAAVLNITGGSINLYGSLRLGNVNDLIGKAANFNLFHTGYYEIAGGTLYLGATDMLVEADGSFGAASMSDGWVIMGGKNMLVYSGAFVQTGGVIFLQNMATGYLNRNNSYNGIFGGDIVLSNSTVYAIDYTLTLGAGNGTYAQTSGNLAMGDGATFNSIDGALQTHTFAGKFALYSAINSSTTTANFAVDLDAQNFVSDVFSFSGGTAAPGDLAAPGNSATGVADTIAMGGTVILSQVNLLNSPTVAVVPFTIMESPSYDSSIQFAAGSQRVSTAVGDYGLYSLGSGNYELRLQDLNPAGPRGGVAASAVLSAQTMLNNIMFEHIFMDSNECLHCEFAPWQFERHKDGVFAKAYGGKEKLNLNQALDEISNDSFGVIAGYDFDAVSIGGRWHWVPTFYMEYNGGKQSFNGVEMTQNGAQAGLMSSWSDGDFIAAILGYGGIYNNKIQVAGTDDSVDNWFAGAAGKLAYDWRPGTQNVIIQPNLTLSYNYFGAQNWNSNYGDIAMHSDKLAGFTAIPGISAMLGMDSFNAFFSGSYVKNMMNKVKNTAGQVEMQDLTAPDSYFEYGVGLVGQVADSTSVEAKINLRSGNDISGISGHIGLSSRF
ncbi:MAG: hypothetical protein LBJ18_03790 [Rickettsiales bacterium]|jgi:predicted outer membrane repeat protein|nr:hypothetical protein [Rickettsiales bacterium]